MNPTTVRNIREYSTSALAWLRRAFDAIATWVTQLSWWKFFIFAIVVMVAGGLMNDAFFEQHVVVVSKNDPARKGRTITDGDTDIHIDSTGIHIRKKTDPGAAPAAPAPGESPVMPPVPDVPPVPSVPGKDANSVHIPLPPELGKEVSAAIEEAVDDAAEQKIATYRQSSSKWFMNFVLAMLVGLFGMKALMGGKKRAEAQAQAAISVAEREALQRQVTEAKMQMMQAQVEPHFLFNTLASVEFLIETDPPRASRMQRSLIQYLRAVLPQMREQATATTLGRETDIVKAYLDLLKMRMEERLCVELQVPDGLRSAAFPPMMLQSMVENAIKHGLEPKEEGGTLKVVAEIYDSRLRVSVIDDGLGFGAVKSNGTGLGLQNIRERLKLLFGDQAQLIIVPNEPSGVRVTIEVPYQLANHK